ncbi:hypothetical protein K9B32_13435 [Rhizobium sp. 3T7]|uniref:hypothetical protein n=1 Tax=Rhizobium sp. 3T7 TaxID=2874922 RepID=UPI001CCAD9F3|nr:hypothetical protein [Rhizobium sp. 3T7]MBZ9791116.1 hypothetical protein [Rhizobium sp. 3T7]
MQLRPTQKEKVKKQEESRRRERRRREDEYRRRIERLRRQIAEARRRRQQMLLLFLLAVIAMQESILATFRRSYIHWPDPAPEPKDWTPDPANDFAPRPGHDDHCDGFSREQWNRMLDERGIRISRKAEIKTAWEADPDRELFPERYQLWGSKPHLGQIMYDLTAPYWQQDALTALKLLSPPETHKYLKEACLTDLRDLLMCRAESSDEIVRNFRVAAIHWDIRKEKEAEEVRREKELSRKDDDGKGVPGPK